MCHDPLTKLAILKCTQNIPKVCYAMRVCVYVYTDHPYSNDGGVDATLSVLSYGGEQLTLVIDRVHCGTQVSEEDDPACAVSVLDCAGMEEEEEEEEVE